MTLPGETEAGSAGMQPCQGIAWWAHRDDDRARGASSRSSQRSIGSVDPYALKIPARKGGNHSLTENPASPFHAEPGQPSRYGDKPNHTSTLDNYPKRLVTIFLCGVSVERSFPQMFFLSLQ
jgi:hypothetical protein